MAEAAGRTRVVLALCALVLIGAIAVGFWPWNVPTNQVRPKPDPNSSACGPGHRPFFQVLDPGPKEATPPLATVDNREPLNDENADDSHDDPELRFLELRFVTDQSEALTGIEIDVVGNVDGWLSPPQPLRVGAHGFLVLSCTARTTSIQVFITDPVWHSDVTDLPLTGRRTKKTITLHKLVTVEFDIRYQDGEQFVGRVSPFSGELLPSREIGGKRAFGGGFYVTSNPFEVKGVSPRDATLNLYTERAGYKRFDYDVRREELFEGARIAIVIAKPPNPPGSIVVHFDLDQFPKPTQHWYHKLVPDDYRGSEESNRHNQRPAKEFAVHEVIPGWYTFSVSDESRVWVTRLQVQESQETHVYADLAVPASASIRVIDEAGEPVAGACLTGDSRSHVDYPVRDQPGVRVATDISGQAELGGLSTTQDKLFVEAQGYERQEISIALVAGRTTDLGTVRLVPAVGRIEVRLLNMKPGKSYQAMCIHPWGRGGDSTRVSVPESGIVVFDRMQLRDYLIAAHFEGGGKVTSRNVSLTNDASNAVVELDVSSIEEEAK